MTKEKKSKMELEKMVKRGVKKQGKKRWVKQQNL